MRSSPVFVVLCCWLLACIGDLPGGGKTAGGDAGPDDASADARATSDASDAASSGADAEPCQASLTTTCSISSCSSTSACCVMTNGTTCTSGCAAYPTWECAQPSDCASASLTCCVHMSATATVSAGCPRVAIGAHGATCDAYSGTTPACNDGDYLACTSNADCAGHGVCTPVELDIGNIVVGLCL